jgi:hypothetical protein
MKKSIFFLISLLIVSVFSEGQKKEIKTLSDLPIRTYSIAMLKAGDKKSIYTWMKNTAAIESKHIDSVFKNCNVTDLNVQVFLIRLRALCDFSMGNWQDLQHTDTVFRSMAEAYPPFKKAGITELAAYAKAKLQYSPDFSKSYVSFFTDAMKPLNENEKIFFIGYTVGGFNNAKNSFEKALMKVKASSSIADTLMYGLFNGYVFSRFDTAIGRQLLAFLNTSIKEKFKRADTLRGSITPERAWWNVLHYDITVKPDYGTKTIVGTNEIRYEVISDSYPAFMQIDLQEPLIIDSVLFNDSRKLDFSKDGNVWHVAVPKQKKSSINNVLVYYHGTPHEAITPPWDGGWVWTKDSLGNPWMSVACQGIGASIWYPCKDIQSDEPDSGATLSMIVPDSLIGIANGRPYPKKDNNDGTSTYKWRVVNPINNYDIIPYIGKYINYSEVYDGAKGKLDLNYWVLNYNLDKAKAHMIPEVHRMLKAHEYWMGPYPFYEDGYKLVDAPYEGMEHQSDVAYGNKYMNGAEGQDYSGSGWGMKWDYIIVHESGHEWFGNNITSNDIADMWVHEGFTMYSETLFTDYYYGNKAGDEYTFGNRGNIQNLFPVIGYYGVNDDISGRNQDMYYKGSNLLHTIRHSMNNDSLFREILRGLNKTFYHQTVTSLQVEKYISDHAGFDYGKVFDQYLRNTAIPQFEFYFSTDKKTVTHRYTNCIEGFNLPIVLKNDKDSVTINSSTQWKTTTLTLKEVALFDAIAIEKMYYIVAKKVAKK